MGCFKLSYDGAELILPKEEVKFQDGYGIVRAYGYTSSEDDYIIIPIVGIVNESYEEILPLTMEEILNKLDIIDENNIIYRYLVDFDYKKYAVSLIKMENKMAVERIDLQSNDYKVIAKNIIKLQTNIEGENMYFLYRTSDDKLLTPFLNELSDFVFNEELGIKCARAALYIFDENDMVVDEIYFYIDENGMVLSSFWDNVYNIKIEADSVEAAMEWFRNYFNICYKGR